MPCRDGSAKLPARATSARARRIFLTSPLRPVRCCCRRLGHTLHEPIQSPSRPRTRPCPFRMRSSDERAVARVCREAGARVARNVRVVADMNIDVPVADDRCIEVVANGLFLWPLARTGEPHPRADVEPGRCHRSSVAQATRHVPRAPPCPVVSPGRHWPGSGWALWHRSSHLPALPGSPPSRHHPSAPPTSGSGRLG